MFRVHAAALLFLVATHSQAQVSACAPATGPTDERAARIAMLNAVSTEVRAKAAPQTAGSMQYANESVRMEVSSVVSAKLKQASIVRRQYVADADGHNARICVDVVIRDEELPRR